MYLQGTDPRVYRSLVITARAAIRAADPLATVLGPDVSWHGVKDGWFAAVMNDFGDLFDVVTVHWYADGPDLDADDGSARAAGVARQAGVDDRSRDEAVRVALRRGGAGAAVSAACSTAFQARRSWWTGVLFYDLYEPPWGRDCGTAITRADWSNRPAFLLYQAFIRQSVAQGEACGGRPSCAT